MHFTTINLLIVNPMEKKKNSFRFVHLKPKVIIPQYLLARILFQRSINHGYVIWEDVVPLWLLTFININQLGIRLIKQHDRCRETPSARIPYGPIITKLLATFIIDTMEETEDSTNHRIADTSLK